MRTARLRVLGTTYSVMFTALSDDRGEVVADRRVRSRGVVRLSFEHPATGRRVVARALATRAEDPAGRRFRVKLIDPLSSLAENPRQGTAPLPNPSILEELLAG